ncbi:FxsA family protein [Cerasibacillus terrae]|uniref:FxsA family protein n=1 Tax=Cerasibacillus terrae TaxID=2498845 RepID=A0A5C8NMX3_9BACI|nr:FxsA family protein [Cerasibacillus terrae]TXL62496.1 FxsA family protein [Cerasibacillus terrae]
MRLIWLVLLIVSALEIGVFVWIGGLIGPWWVVLLIILTGIIGITLAKKQGMDTIRRAQASLHYGKVPKEEIFDGICILIGAIFLITPGFITDILGFIFILPVTRGIFKTRLYKLVKKWIEKNTITFGKW